MIKAALDAGGDADLRHRHPADPAREQALKEEFPEVTYVNLAELVATPLTELSRSMTRGRVHQYQRYFEDADRVLILLHNDPDPDAMASGLALARLLRRNKTTAIIGAVQNVTRPENLRMKHLLDIYVETVTSADFKSFERIATVDVQPHYFGDALERADLVIDHHPEQANHNAVFKDIRPTTARPARSSPSTSAPSTSTSRSASPPRCSTPSSPTRSSSRARPTASTSRRSRTSTRWPTPR